MNPPKYLRNLAIVGIVFALIGVGFSGWLLVVAVGDGSPWWVLISGILLAINAYFLRLHIRNLKTYYDY